MPEKLVTYSNLQEFKTKNDALYVPQKRKVAGLSLENDITKAEMQNALDINKVFEEIKSTNLFDASSDDMRTIGSWYYSNTVGSTLVKETSPDTNVYTAVKIPVDDGTSAVAFSRKGTTNYIFYGIYAVDENMKVLKISDNTAFATVNNYVFSYPSGTKYVCISLLITTQSGLNNIMCANGTTPLEYADYFTPYFAIKNDVDLRITNNKLPNGVVSIPKTDFIKTKYPDNLFNSKSDDMRTVGGWYYSNSVGSTLALEIDQYTTAYTGCKIPVYGAEAITFSTTQFPGMIFYGIYAVDADMKILKIADNSAQTLLNNYTFTLPAGTVYVCISVTSNQQDRLNDIMCASGTEAKPFKEYKAPFYYIENFDIIDESQETFTENTKSIIGSDANKILVKLPTKYELVVGDTFELFYKGIIECQDINQCYIEVLCNKGKGFNEKFIFTPQAADIGNISLTISVYGINHNLLDSKSTTLSIKAKASAPASNKNILCVGDSLTNGGQWVREFRRRLIASGGTPAGDELTNLTFIGTRQLYDGTKYEGYGGWTFNSYNTANVTTNVKILTVSSHDKTEVDDQHSIYKDANNNQWKLETIETNSIKIIAIDSDGNNFPATGTLTWVSGGVNHSNIVYTASTNGPGNPFWDGSKVDFGWYATQLGVTSIDYVYVLLGWNSQSTPKATYKQQCQTFIDNVKASFPNAIIVLMGLEIPAKEGLANNYGSGSSDYANYYKSMQFVFNIEEWYNEIATDNTNVSVINISGQFDTIHNMLTSTMQVNTRNATTQTYQSNGVHPADSGYYQISDAVYRDFVHKLQD